MFSDDVNESWESTAFQDNFIKDYFGKKSPLKGAAKVYKKTNVSLNETKIPCIKNSNADDVKSNERSSFNRKKKKKSLESLPQGNLSSNSLKSKKLEKKSLKDSLVTYSNLIKSGKKKIKFKSKDEKLMNQTELSSPDNLAKGKDRETQIAGNGSSSKKNKTLSRAYEKLQAAKFRYLNELLYTNTGKDALSYFQDNSEEFEDYHVGYQAQVLKWPINPVDIIIKDLCKMSKQSVIADLGCGAAKIAEVLPDRTVHSFDLIALKDCVTACDMANLPLPDKSVDVTVFCLSLMGTNWKDYLVEGRRILKLGGYLKIAEIESRIENVDDLIKNIEYYGFSLVSKNLSHKMFVFLNFIKKKNNVKSTKVKAVTLKPCLYKKR